MRINPVTNLRSTQNYNKTNPNVNFEKKVLTNKISSNKKTIIRNALSLLFMMLPTSCVAQKVSKPQNELPQYLQENSIQYSKEFELDGKKHTMYYVDYNQQFSENRDAVSGIYFVPKDFQLHKKDDKELNTPMMLENLIYHDLENKKDFVSAVVTEVTCDKNGENQKQITKEIILPNNIGKKLMKLYQGKTNKFLIPSINTYTKTSDEKLMAPVVHKF